MKNNYNLKQNTNPDYSEGFNLIKRHFKPVIKTFLLILLFLLISTVIGSSILPSLIKKAIDVDILNKDLIGLQNTTLLFVALSIINTVFSYFRVYITGKLSETILFNIREELFAKLQTLPSQFFSDNQSGEIIQRLTGNVENISNFFSEGMVRILEIIFSMSIILISMFIYNWQLALIALIGGIGTLIFIVVQGIIVEKPIAKSLEKEGDISAFVQETMDGFVAIQTENQQKNWEEKFIQRNTDYYNSMKKVSQISSTSDAFFRFMMMGTILGSIIYALFLSKDGIITIGTVVLFITFIENFFQHLEGISSLWRAIKTSLGSAQRINEILKLESDIESKGDAYTPKEMDGDIEFRDVDFSYDNDNNVLSDVNFIAPKGKTIAIVGPTGSGKTTFVNLIARLYDVKNGKILIDGKDIKDWDLSTLRKNIGYLIQDTFLFEDTILNNLKYNNPQVTEEKALEIFAFLLGEHSFIESLPEKLNTKIDLQSGNLSAGQKQIVALARILLRNPKVLILDEATARIDTKSEKMLQHAIEKACFGKTTFIIAHRLSTIFNADQIILIKDNTILEKGTHRELLEKNGFYAEMYSRFVGK